MNHAKSDLPWRDTDVCVRRLHASDLDAFQNYRTDPQLQRYQGWQIQPDHDALAFILGMQNAVLFENQRWCQLAITLADNLVIGDIGICIKETWAEIGYTLHASFQQQGIASRVCRLVMRNIFAHTQVFEVRGITDARNTASVQLLEAVGMVVTQTMKDHDVKGVTELVYAITRPQWDEIAAQRRQSK